MNAKRRVASALERQPFLSRLGGLVLGLGLTALAVVLVVPVALLVVVVVLPFLVVLGLARLAFWLIVRLVAQVVPERRASEHRWPAVAIWVVALAAGVGVGLAATWAAPVRLAYVAAVGKPVSAVLGKEHPAAIKVAKVLCRSLAPAAKGCLGLPARQPAGGTGFDLVVALAVVAGLVVGARKNGDARRIALIDARPVRSRTAPLPPAGPSPPSGPGKTIVICSDGTSNHPGQLTDGKLAPTNVVWLHDALADATGSGWSQHRWYDPGVGTGTSGMAIRARRLARVARWIVSTLPSGLADTVDRAFKAFEGATGAGIEENIAQGYLEIVRRYEPGDRIVLVGFSRGAYTARCIAGVIARCGLLRSEFLRFGPDVITLYRRRTAASPQPLVDPAYCHPSEKVVHVLALWDTVASLGLPLWGWWFRPGALWRHLPLDTNPASVCEHVYHAVAIDERRAQFFPTLVTPVERGPTVDQQWFRGAHADVGGGYAEPELAGVSLRWMLDHLARHGVQLGAPGTGPALPAPNALGAIHDEIQRVPGWEALGSWPRWHPITRPGDDTEAARAVTAEFGRLADSVRARAEHAARRWQARLAATPAGPGRAHVVDDGMAAEGFVFLDVGDRVRVAIPADRQWTRTGVVIEQGAAYRLSAEGQWRDAGQPPCGPQGQDARGFDLARRLFAHGKRRRTARWMELMGHVAHPRRWPLFELGFFRLVKFLWFSDPAPLVWSLLRLGEHMAPDPATGQPGSVHLRHEGASGVFHAFPNDCWETYANNSGQVVLTIERVAEVPAGVPCLVVDARGQVRAETHATAVPVPAFTAIPPARGTLFGVPGPPAPAAAAGRGTEPAPVAFATWRLDEL